MAGVAPHQWVVLGAALKYADGEAITVIGMAEPLSDRDLRVSNDERAHVIGLLEKATARGLIGSDECSTRSETARAAKTRGELNALLLDLPGLVNGSAPAAEAIAGSMTSIKRSGRWTVPAEFTVRNSLARTLLDFREAKIEFGQVWIHLAVTAGVVRMRLPEHATVNAEAVQFSLGRFHGRRVRIAEAPGTPHFVVTGKLACGSLAVFRTTTGR